LANKAQKIAIEGYRAIGCKVFGRVDMIIRNNQVYILEVNTIPGLTAVSLFPKAAQAAGIPYSLLLDKIIEYSLQKYEH
jgi:D-alanine-D-alanine ligase